MISLYQKYLVLYQTLDISNISYHNRYILHSLISSLFLSPCTGSRDVEPPANATQEQYDRWLAFQLAKAEDDLPPSEFNKKHRPTFRRSLSMPERAVGVHS